MIDNILNSITLRDIIYSIVGILTVGGVIVEKANRLPFKPWTAIFKFIGGCFTGHIDEQLNRMEEQQRNNTTAIKELDEKVEKKFREKQKEDDEKEAIRLRADIIRFSDACRTGERHSQNHFENIFREYSDYLSYCQKHNLPNHYIDAEYAFIEEIYQKRLRNNDFI